MLSPVPARRPAPRSLWGALTPLSPALCRRAAVLRAAPSLWLPHPHRQLHRQPGPAAEDALQQVGKQPAPSLGPWKPEGTGTYDVGRAGCGRQTTL